MLYAIQNTRSDDGFGRFLFKVGFTDGDPKRRLTNLQVGTSDRLRLFATSSGTRDDEDDFKRRNKKYKVVGGGPRLEGEWYRFTEQEINERFEMLRRILDGEKVKIGDPRGEQLALPLDQPAVFNPDSMPVNSSPRWRVFEIIVVAGMLAEEVAERRAA